MRTRLRRLLTPPLFENEDETYSAQVLNAIIWVVIIAVFLLAIPRWGTNAWISPTTGIFLGILLIISLISFALMHRGYIRAASVFFVGFAWLTLIAQAALANGLWDVALLTLPALILLTALLLGWRKGIASGILSLVVLVCFAYLQTINPQPPPVRPPYKYAWNLGVVFMASSALVYILIYRLNRSLFDARLELRERLRAEEKLQAQADYLAALHETTLGLINRLELKPLLRTILHRSAELLGTEHVGIYLVEADDAAIYQEMGSGLYKARDGDGVKKGEGLIGKAWQSKETIVINEYEDWADTHFSAMGKGMRSVIGVPLKSGERTLGLLSAASLETPNFFTYEKTILLERFASLAALAIENARLYESAQKDILERRIAEENLRSSEERFRKVFNNSNVAICIISLGEGIFLDANQAFLDLFGFDASQALGHSAKELNLWNSAEEREKFLKELFEKESLENIASEFVDGLGRSRAVLGSYELIDIKGQRCILCMLHDISAARQMQRDLEASENRMRAILNAIPDLTFEVSKDGIFLDLISSSELELALEPQEFIGRNIKDVFSTNIGEQMTFALERALKTNHIHAFEYGLPEDEEVQFFEARVTAATSESAIIMVRDISQRRWAETEREKLIGELEAKNAESETLRESVAIIAETLDENKAVTLILDQLEKVIPYDSASVQLTRDGDLEIVSIRGLEPIQEHLSLIFPVNEKEPIYPLIKGIEPYLLIEDVLDSFPKFYEGYEGKLHEDIQSWLVVPLKVKGKIIGVITLDGHSKRKFNRKHAELALIYAGQVAVALENARLFSDLQNELSVRKLLIEELENKNAELERFTYTVSHDLKSPVITIRGFLGFLESDALSGNMTRLRGDIKRISDATDKMQRLLNELLDLSRVGRQVNQPIAVSFNEIVNEALELVQGRIQENQVRVQVQENMETVFVDRQRIVEAVQNLIDNAAKFVGENPLIEIGQQGKEEEMPLFFIRDNGVGIPAAHFERIFGLFNKLDAVSDGTGVGLALVKRIVEIHKGRIWVESKTDVGSTFFFTLPAKPQTDS